MAGGVDRALRMGAITFVDAIACLLSTSVIAYIRDRPLTGIM